MKTENQQPELFRKLSEEVREKIAALTARVKADAASGADTGTFEFVISTADFDRHGESIDQKGWDLQWFKLNPVVLWAHDYGAPPIGIADTVEVKDGKLVATGHFASAEANPFAQQVRNLYDEGIIRATSVGLIIKEEKGNVITQAELLEFSFVPVPANPHALRLNELGIDVRDYVSKGLLTEDASEKGEIADAINAEDVVEKKYAVLDEVREVFSAFRDAYMADDKSPDDYGPLLAEMGQILIDMSKGAAPTEEAKTAMKALTPEAKKKATILWMKHAIATKTLKEDVGALLGNMQSKVDTILVDAAQAILAAVGDDGEPAPAEEPKTPEEGDGEEGKDASEKDVKVKEGRVLSEKNRSLIQNAISPLKDVTAALEELLVASQGDESQKDPNGGGANKRSKGSGSDESKALNEWLQTRQVLRSVSSAVTAALEDTNKRIRSKS